MTIVSVKYNDNCIFIKLDVGLENKTLFQNLRNVYVNYSIQIFENSVSENVVIKQEDIVKLDKGFVIRIPLEPMKFFEEAAIIIKNLIFTYQDGIKEEWIFHKKFHLHEIKFPRILNGEQLVSEEIEESKSKPRKKDSKKKKPTSLMEDLGLDVQEKEEKIESNIEQVVENLELEIDQTCCKIYDLMLSVLPKIQDEQKFELTKSITDSIRSHIKRLSEQCEEAAE